MLPRLKIDYVEILLTNAEVGLENNLRERIARRDSWLSKTTVQLCIQMQMRK